MANWYSVASQAIYAHGALHQVDELAMLLRYLAEQEPAAVLEIGTWNGGAAWAFAHLPGIERVISVDLAAQPHAHIVEGMAGGRIVLVEGDSTDLATRAAVLTALDRTLPDVVVIDGGHDYKTALSDFTMYAPLAGAHGLVVMHDTQGYPGNPGIEVPKVWAQLAAKYRTLELVSRRGGPCGTGIVWL